MTCRPPLDGTTPLSATQLQASYGPAAFIFTFVGLGGASLIPRFTATRRGFHLGVNESCSTRGSSQLRRSIS
jgi:hypothetical protein